MVIDSRHDKYATAEPVEDHGEIDKAARHRNVGYVHRPNLVRPRDLHSAQQIRVDLVTGFRLCRAGAAIQRLYPHPLHERSDMPAAGLAPLGSQQTSQHARTREGMLQMQPVEPPHDCKVGFRHRPWQVVDAAPADGENFGLSGYR